MTEGKATDTEPEAGVTCAACPHRWDAHDSIGIRYCSATVARGLHRGCVCAGSAAAEPQSPSVTGNG
ncbi:MAG TPA: RGCVC family protein [Amycolatopsis sp.]|uniref:RGCVC family protein n=1 Tax=Amycolatopsis sp. TaxID=37632 RepID=UPI002B497C4D|nr:RGCVC family protein [Amycolatopsis sp.]HKS44582.1 RGCVC family protein [Amycolatopsis sp.]